LSGARAGSAGLTPERYRLERLWAEAADGERIPISIVHRHDVPLDRSAPCLLYGYGAYGASLNPGFAVERLPLIERGFVYAIAHVRGGAEMGQRWYRAGKLEQRVNAFADFVSAAEALVAAGYTDRGRIVAHGRSAGGMLVGAALNMAPDLFAGVVADVPFVDVLNTMLDTELPLTPPEWLEWGNPISDADAFVRIRSYAPYGQVASVLSRGARDRGARRPARHILGACEVDPALARPDGRRPVPVPDRVPRRPFGKRGSPSATRPPRPGDRLRATLRRAGVRR